MNKCPNCGYKYGDNDAFCAMCGVRLPQIPDEPLEETNIDLNDANQEILDNIDNFIDETEEKTDERKFNFDENTTSTGLVSFAAIVISICILMGFFLYLVIKKQENSKLQMRYNNMILNPALIPELKEPKGLLDLKVNLQSCENFLSLYLKHSKDPLEIKEQVFISYLVEMDKLPHITNENMVMDGIDSCSNIDSNLKAQNCAKKISYEMRHVGISAYNDNNVIYLYPNYNFIAKKYSKHLSEQMVRYLKLKAKYNIPARVGLTLKIKPKRIADKIHDFEFLFSKITDSYIRDEILKTIYYDFRTFIFTPTIYATTTQEMKKEFKNAFNYFISSRRNSQLRPLMMSYMDKMRSYSEENFRNDYPYQIFDDDFNTNVENSSLSDIFVQLRKRLFSDSSQSDFAYIYNISSQKWSRYENSRTVSQNEYIFSEPDTNNNISVYNNTYSLMQELNIPKYSKLFLSGNSLFIYNIDKLRLSKLIFNGRLFSLQELNSAEASTIFPGVNVINIDSYQNYNIYVEKDNAQADYIILSKYTQGFDGYELTPLKGNVVLAGLFNMFKTSSNNDIELSFHHYSVNARETSENTPTYRIIIHTRGNSFNDEVEYDEKTANEEDSEVYQPTIMPKIMRDNDDTQDIKESHTENLDIVPSQNIEPPTGD